MTTAYRRRLPANVVGCVASFAFVSLLPTATTLLAQQNGAAAKPIVLSHVTVVDVNGATGDRALRKDQTVIVVGDRIAAVGKGIQVPSEARVVDARGKFLIPGLWDMHVHITDASYLGMFIANGVTGVRDMGGGAAGANDGCESIVADSLIDWRNRVWRSSGPRSPSKPSGTPDDRSIRRG